MSCRVRRWQRSTKGTAADSHLAWARAPRGAIAPARHVARAQIALPPCARIATRIPSANCTPMRPLVQCVTALHRIWVLAFESPESCVFFRYLHAKFRRATNHNAASVTPPATAPARIPPVPSTPVHSTIFREYMHAITRESRGRSAKDASSQNRAASWNGRHRPRARVIIGSP